MKILFITDTHITAKTPSSRVDDIQDTIKLKMKEIGVMILKENIDLVLHGGDMFHRPEVSNKFVGEIAEIIRGYQIPFYVVPGNHDLQGQNEDSLPHSKLGLLASAGVIKILDRKNPIALNDNGYIISIEGQEYYPHIDKHPLSDYAVHNKSADFKILVAHSMLLERDYHEGTVYTLIENVQTDADLILSGHYHPGYGYKINSKGTKFINPGSLLRVEASTYSINNKPKVCILDISNGTFSQRLVELQISKEGKDVFSQKSIEKKGYEVTLENFNSKLKNIKLDDVNILKLVDSYTKNHPEDINVINKAKDEIIKIQRDEVVDNGYIPATSNVAIDKVEIKNFQVHKDISVNFANGLNTIIGESNAGKTAILRSIYWALYDKPNGSDFITTGQKSCSVKVFLSNGYCIERKRSRTSSGSYILTKPDGKSQEYKGFGNNIPIDIINAHQMPEIKISGNPYRLNISAQLDAPFLTCSTSNERMAMIGALVDADRADAAKKAILSEKRSLSMSIRKTDELKDNETKKLDKYSNLDKLNTKLQTLEMVDAKLDKDEMQLKELEDLNHIYGSVLSNVSFINSELSSINILDNTLIDDFKNGLSELSELKEVNDLYNNTSITINSISESFRSLGEFIDKSTITEYNNSLNCLEKLMKYDTKYRSHANALSQILESFESVPKYTVDRSDIDTFRNVLSDYEELLMLEKNFKDLERKKFDFSFDLDLLTKIRVKYIDFIKLYNELDKVNQDLESFNKKVIEIESLESKVNKELTELIRIKEVKINELKSKTYICEACGSEVTVNKLVTEHVA